MECISLAVWFHMDKISQTINTLYICPQIPQNVSWTKEKNFWQFTTAIYNLTDTKYKWPLQRSNPTCDSLLFVFLFLSKFVSRNLVIIIKNSSMNHIFHAKCFFLKVSWFQLYRSKIVCKIPKGKKCGIFIYGISNLMAYPGDSREFKILETLNIKKKNSPKTTKNWDPSIETLLQ